VVEARGRGQAARVVVLGFLGVRLLQSCWRGMRGEGGLFVGVFVVLFVVCGVLVAVVLTTAALAYAAFMKQVDQS